MVDYAVVLDVKFRRMGWTKILGKSKITELWMVVHGARTTESSWDGHEYLIIQGIVLFWWGNTRSFCS